MKIKQLYNTKVIGSMADWPVQVIEVYTHDIKIVCKNVEGLYSQVKKFTDDTIRMKTHYYSWGKTACKITQQDPKNPNAIKIGCLDSNTEEISELLENAEQTIADYNNQLFNTENNKRENNNEHTKQKV